MARTQKIFVGISSNFPQYYYMYLFLTSESVTTRSVQCGLVMSMLSLGDVLAPPFPPPSPPPVVFGVFEPFSLAFVFLAEDGLSEERERIRNIIIKV